MELGADSPLTVAVYTADAGSRSQQALALLANETAPPHEAPVGATGDGDASRPPERRGHVDHPQQRRTQRAPGDRFTGDVYVDGIAHPAASPTVRYPLRCGRRRARQPC